MADRRVDHDTRERLEVIQAVVDSERRRVTILLVLVVVLLFSLSGVTFYLRGQDSQRASEGKRLALAIQENRVATVRETCRDGKRRHDETIRTLNKLLRRSLASATTPEQRAQIERSRASTTLLINALAPRRDCAAVIRDLTSTVR